VYKTCADDAEVGGANTAHDSFEYNSHNNHINITAGQSKWVHALKSCYPPK